mmetsp:Transcript_16161/g.23734  ORF Transcript_16161/g.23734 Transcript_16161/m.23734 type:complete len:112 (-) Transcript_16161:1507-1842(-)
MTMIWSACRMVDRRWAMTRVVRLARSLDSACCTEISVRVSRADVASSKSTTGGSFSRHRAIATLCFSPPDSFSPRSPTTVSHCSGRLSMKGRIWAASQAWRTSSMVASRRP